MTTPHAVRWIIGKQGPEAIYSKWHYTDNASWTKCERMIRLMDVYDYKLPDTDNDLSRVDCKLCLSRKNK